MVGRANKGRVYFMGLVFVSAAIVFLCVLVLTTLVCMRKSRNRYRNVAALFSLIGWLGLVLVAFSTVNYYLAFDITDIEIYLAKD